MTLSPKAKGPRKLMAPFGGLWIAKSTITYSREAEKKAMLVIALQPVAAEQLDVGEQRNFQA